MSKIDELLRLSICLKMTILCVFDRLETKVHALDAMDACFITFSTKFNLCFKKKAITVFIIVRHVKEGFKNFICKHAEQ